MIPGDGFYRLISGILLFKNLAAVYLLEDVFYEVADNRD